MISTITIHAPVYVTAKRSLDQDFACRIRRLEYLLGSDVTQYMTASGQCVCGLSQGLCLCGKALDFYIDRVSPRRVLRTIISNELFYGIGWYPYWLSPGFHVDGRPKSEAAYWCSHAPGYIYPMEVRGYADE